MSENDKPQHANTAPSAIEADIPFDSPEHGAGNPETTGHTSFDKIVETVLNSAGVANQSASLAATSTENLLNAVGDLGAITSRARVTSMVVLFTSALLLAAAAGAFFTVSVQLNSRLTQANSTLAIVAKGAGNLNADLEKWKRLDKLIEEMEGQKTSENIEKLETKIDTAISDLKKQATVAPAQPEKSNKQEELRNKALTDLIRNLETQTQSQARMIAKLTEQVQVSRADVSKILGAVRSVDSQIANLHEKQRSAPPAPQPAPVAHMIAQPPVASIATQVREREKPPTQKNKDYIQYRAPETENQPSPR